MAAVDVLIIAGLLIWTGVVCRYMARRNRRGGCEGCSGCSASSACRNCEKEHR